MSVQLGMVAAMMRRMKMRASRMSMEATHTGAIKLRVYDEARKLAYSDIWPSVAMATAWFIEHWDVVE